MCPRISANDFTHLLLHDPDAMIAIDLRSVNDYARVHVANSINVPFSSVQLNEPRLECLNVANLEQSLAGRIVVCLSNAHENALQVRASGLKYRYHFFKYKFLSINSFRNFLWNAA